MKIKITGYRFSANRPQSVAIFTRALQLEDAELTKLMLEAGWVIPFEDVQEVEEPASWSDQSMPTSRKRGHNGDINGPGCDPDTE